MGRYDKESVVQPLHTVRVFFVPWRPAWVDVQKESVVKFYQVSSEYTLFIFFVCENKLVCFFRFVGVAKLPRIIRVIYPGADELFIEGEVLFGKERMERHYRNA